MIRVILATLLLAGCGAIDGASVSVQAGKGPCAINISGAEVIIDQMRLACRGGQLPSADANTVVAAPTGAIAVPEAGGVTRPGAVRIIPPPRR